MKTIVLIPINGLVNKLRSIASTLALFPNDKVYCYWNEEYLLRGERPLISHDRLVYISSADCDELTAGISLESQGLNTRAGTISLWHPKGEQEFVRDLIRGASSPDVDRIIIRSGGEFGLGGRSSRIEKRRRVYSQFQWEPEVEAGFENLRLATPYLGLHLRGKDLQALAPSDVSIERGLASLSRQLRASKVFIASDTQASSDYWRNNLSKKGFEVHLQPSPEFDMSTSHGVLEAGDAGAIAAGVDFLALARSAAMIYGHTSSFGHEASVQTTYPRLCEGLYPRSGRLRYAVNVARREAGVGRRITVWASRLKRNLVPLMKPR